MRDAESCGIRARWVSGNLHAVTYGQLTQAADDHDYPLASLTADQRIPVANGTYDLTIKQLRNNIFEVLIKKAKGDSAPVWTEPLWWSEAQNLAS